MNLFNNPDVLKWVGLGASIIFAAISSIEGRKWVKVTVSLLLTAVIGFCTMTMDDIADENQKQFQSDFKSTLDSLGYTIDPERNIIIAKTAPVSVQNMINNYPEPKPVFNLCTQGLPTGAPDGLIVEKIPGEDSALMNISFCFRNDPENVTVELFIVGIKHGKAFFHGYKHMMKDVKYNHTDQASGKTSTSGKIGWRHELGATYYYCFVGKYSNTNGTGWRMIKTYALPQENIGWGSPSTEDSEKIDEYLAPVIAQYQVSGLSK